MIQKKPISVLGAFQYKVLHDLRHHSVFIFDDEERGQNSRKNWRRGETEHKCKNINFSLKVFWKNLNDIDLLNLAKRNIFLTVCNCRRCRQNIFFSLDKPDP